MHGIATSRPTIHLRLRIIAIACLVMLCVVAVEARVVETAHADAFGELASVGKFGNSPEEFEWPTDLAVDQADNSVFVLDEPGAAEPGIAGNKSRIQKFTSGLGAPVASVTIGSGPQHGEFVFIAGIAIDPVLERLYVLKAINQEEENEHYVGYEIEAYSTNASSGTLPTAPGVSGGIFYSFPATTPSTGTLARPKGLAVDPSTHDLILLGADNSSSTVIQRVGFAPPPAAEHSTGKFEAEFDDTSHEIAQSGTGASGVTVAPGGSLYLSTFKTPTGGPGIVKLSADFGTATVLHEDVTQTPRLTGGTATGNGRNFGAQVAISPDGSTVYAAETAQAENAAVQPQLAGNYEVRGISTTNGSQQVVYGGGTTSCLVASAANAMAAGGNGVVYALDEGDHFQNAATKAIEPTTFGTHLIEFGPGGSGCPEPSTSFKVNTDSASPTVVVQKGEEVKFEASSAELHSEEPTELVWEGEGPEKYKTEVKGTPASLATTHKFLKPGLYTVTLKMTVSPGSLGSPAAVTRKVEVKVPAPTASFESSTLSPKPGESVTFNGGESLDPAGSITGGPTHKLKNYKWTFGDGATETTTTPEYARSFSNPSAQELSESVQLVVTNEEGVQSAPTTQTLTIQGTPESKQPVVVVTKEPVKEVPVVVPPVLITKPPVVTPPAKKPLTTAQKLASALKACKKKPKKQRASCEKQAKKKYASKPKKKSAKKK